MKRLIVLTVVIGSLSVGQAIAGLGSKSNYISVGSGETVVAPVSITDVGVYNLEISIAFLNRPDEAKVYESEAYRNMVTRLSLTWSSVALDVLFKRSEIALSDFAAVKKEIEEQVDNLIGQERAIAMPGTNAKVVYSVTRFELHAPGE